MKKIILGLFVFGSFQAHANDLLSIDKNAVLTEVLVSLGAHPLQCVNKVDGKIYNTSQLNIKGVLGEDFDLTIHQSEQPVIIILKKFTNDNSTQLFQVSTDSLYKTVIGIETLHRHAPVVSKVNVGTIIDPVYQEITVEGVVMEQLSCK